MYFFQSKCEIDTIVNDSDFSFRSKENTLMPPVLQVDKSTGTCLPVITYFSGVNPPIWRMKMFIHGTFLTCEAIIPVLKGNKFF